METTVLPPIPQVRPNIGFTAEFAAEMRERKRLKAIERAKAQSEPQPVAIQPESYEERELRFMREEISRTREQMSAETDPDLKFKLGCTLKKDWEIEQLLSNRPGPGTRKPKAEPTRRANQSCDPLDE